MTQCISDRPDRLYIPNDKEDDNEDTVSEETGDVAMVEAGEESIFLTETDAANDVLDKEQDTVDEEHAVDIEEEIPKKMDEECLKNNVQEETTEKQIDENFITYAKNEQGLRDPLDAPREQPNVEFVQSVGGEVKDERLSQLVFLQPTMSNIEDCASVISSSASSIRSSSTSSSLRSYSSQRSRCLAIAMDGSVSETSCTIQEEEQKQLSSPILNPKLIDMIHLSGDDETLETMGEQDDSFTFKEKGKHITLSKKEDQKRLLLRKRLLLGVLGVVMTLFAMAAIIVVVQMKHQPTRVAPSASTVLQLDEDAAANSDAEPFCWMQRTIQDKQHLQLELFLRGITQKVDKIEQRQMELAIATVFNQVAGGTNGCQDAIWKRWMYNVTMLQQELKKDVVVQRDQTEGTGISSPLKTVLADTSFLVTRFAADLSCNNCVPEEAFANVYPTFFGEETDSESFLQPNNIVQQNGGQRNLRTSSLHTSLVSAPSLSHQQVVLDAGTVIQSIERAMRTILTDFVAFEQVTVLTAGNQQQDIPPSALTMQRSYNSSEILREAQTDTPGPDKDLTATFTSGNGYRPSFARNPVYVKFQTILDCATVSRPRKTHRNKSDKSSKDDKSTDNSSKNNKSGKSSKDDKSSEKDSNNDKSEKSSKDGKSSKSDKDVEDDSNRDKDSDDSRDTDSKDDADEPKKEVSDKGKGKNDKADEPKKEDSKDTDDKDDEPKKEDSKDNDDKDDDDEPKNEDSDKEKDQDNKNDEPKNEDSDKEKDQDNKDDEPKKEDSDKEKDQDNKDDEPKKEDSDKENDEDDKNDESDKEDSDKEKDQDDKNDEPEKEGSGENGHEDDFDDVDEEGSEEVDGRVPEDGDEDDDSESSGSEDLVDADSSATGVVSIPTRCFMNDFDYNEDVDTTVGRMDNPPCSVCGGDDQTVTIYDAVFQSPGDRPTTCGLLQIAGAKGHIPADHCSLLPDLIKEPCGCQPIPTAG
ncbi:hypothetical protein IV203_012547 [Nitzschia inconspicua]|uniref:Uncharacterized protein n=1 Tax=Nitzschia inconspicua TaxID=303405 RepID=A0A9K3KVG7_9STRA|nr:hypothetical protein IV203_012547 [Nitzschia inconspicua]